MATDLRLPQLGDVMTEGTLTAWLCEEGAEVRAGEPLYELETDKVTFTIEAPSAGVLRQAVPAGSVVQVGALVGRLVHGEAAEAPAPEVRATPAARRAARELGVDLAGLASGRRIREADVRAAAVPAAVGRREATARRLLESRQATAAVTLTSEVRVDATLDLVEGLNEAWAEDGVVLTLTRVVVKACALALRDHPALNGGVGDAIDVGLAVNRPEGLVVPVLRAADRAPLRDVARRLRELTQRAESGGLTLDDARDGTFTVTSLAATVVDGFTPIINPPQSGILGVGRVREVAAFEGAAVVRHRVTTLSLTFDHQIVDGAPAARFLGRVAELLQRPYLLIEGGP